MDYFLNGQAHGSVASRLLACNGDLNCLRPYIGNDNRSYVTVMQNGKPTAMAMNSSDGTLRKDEWILYDQALLKVARKRLRVVRDLRDDGLVFNLPNGMAHTVLQYERQSDTGPAGISMSGLVQQENDRPIYDLNNLPLPLIVKDFDFDLRQVLASRNGGNPVDTTMVEQAGIKVAEEAEKLTLGLADSYTYGGGTLYGMTNFPSRMTKAMTLPTAGGWTPNTLVLEILAMRAQSVAQLHFGPWRVINSPNWDQYLDEDYSSAKSDNTLRERILKIKDIQSMETSDYLTGYQIIMYQTTGTVIRMVIGFDFTLIQWESHGGMQLNFKCMAMMVPQLRVDMNNNGGIVHGTAV